MNATDILPGYLEAVAWNVYIGRRLIDTVFYDADCDADYVRRGLVDHDGYDAGIRVCRRRSKRHA